MGSRQLLQKVQNLCATFNTVNIMNTWRMSTFQMIAKLMRREHSIKSPNSSPAGAVVRTISVVQSTRCCGLISQRSENTWYGELWLWLCFLHTDPLHTLHSYYTKNINTGPETGIGVILTLSTSDGGEMFRTSLCQAESMQDWLIICAC